jgi:hypothetical protein
MSIVVPIHRAPLAPSARPSAPSLPLSALMGRLTEVAVGSTGGGHSVAAAWVQTAQREGEPVAWIQWAGGNLYPPDLAASGIRLDALLVVHAGEPVTCHDRLRAAEVLLRSGGFGLVVLDLTAGQIPAGLAWQHRLQAWARQSHSAVLVLRTIRLGQTASLGPLVSLQMVPERHRMDDGLFALTCHIGKNKLGQPVSPWQWACCGPPGL